MSKNSLLLFLGSLVIIVSFFGIPSSWKTMVFSILGVLIIIVSLSLRKDITTGALCMHLTEGKYTNSYRQNGPLHSENIDNNEENNLRNDAEGKKENEKVQNNE